jgi:hypothetical protein
MGASAGYVAEREMRNMSGRAASVSTAGQQGIKALLVNARYAARLNPVSTTGTDANA